MTDIIERNPQDNPRLNEIYEILLVAGYFRIRIASLRPFDKVLGGMAWCITSSNFQIDVDYHDQMQIGQKIRASEIICDSLIKMKCPYTLQPFQLQGMDVNNIFPIVQWLIKFVYETRWERQKYDRELSLMLGKKITKIENRGNPQKILKVPIERKRVNRAIMKVNHNHPVRVYSALLQYQDATAAKMYNKLLNIITKKQKNKKGNKNGFNEDEADENFAQMLMKEEKKQEQMLKKGNKSQLQREMDEFGNVSAGKVSLQKLEQIIQENKEQLQSGLKQGHDQENQQLSMGLRNPNKNEQNDDNEQMHGKHKRQQQRILRQAKSGNQKLHQKIQILQNQIQSFGMIEDQLNSQLQSLRQKYNESKEIAQNQIQKNEQYRELHQDMEQQLKQNKAKINQRLEKLVEKRQQLKNKKAQIKKRAKAKIEELSQQTQLAEANVPEIDQQAFKQMLGEAQLKKDIYDKKYEELTLVNKQLAVLQRKAQNYTSPPEIAQYHQRFVELFQSINVLIEEKRSLYSETTNLESLKTVVKNYNEIMKNIKEAYVEIKKKQQLKDLNENMKQILSGLETNTTNSETTLAKMKAKRQSTYSDYMDLIKLERDYLHLLRTLKLEYENAEKHYN